MNKRNTLFLSLLILPACFQKDDTMAHTCVLEYASTTADDDTLGFSANEALAFLDARRPTTILWDEITQSAESEALELKIFGLAGTPSISSAAGDTSSCPFEPPSLFVPLDVEIIVADGEVVGRGLLTVEVSELTTETIWLHSDDNLPTELTGRYNDDFNATFETEYAPMNYAISEIYMSAHSNWSGGMLDIGFRAENEDSLAAFTLWRGHWVIE